MFSILKCGEHYHFCVCRDVEVASQLDYISQMLAATEEDCLAAFQEEDIEGVGALYPSQLVR